MRIKDIDGETMAIITKLITEIWKRSMFVGTDGVPGISRQLNGDWQAWRNVSEAVQNIYAENPVRISQVWFLNWWSVGAAATVQWKMSLIISSVSESNHRAWIAP